MIYPPEAAAETILYAAEHPKKDLCVGTQAIAVKLFGTLLPTVADKLMKHWLYHFQRADRPSKPREESALYKAGFDLRKRSAHYGWIRSGSMYVKASKHPLATRITLIAGGALAWTLTRKKRKT